MRQAAGPTFYVKQGLRRDVAPPSRVIDFHVSSIVNDSLYVELQWSAPGNDYDQGRGNNGTIFLLQFSSQKRSPKIFQDVVWQSQLGA